MGPEKKKAGGGGTLLRGETDGKVVLEGEEYMDPSRAKLAWALPDGQGEKERGLQRQAFRKISHNDVKTQKTTPKTGGGVLGGITNSE